MQRRVFQSLGYSTQHACRFRSNYLRFILPTSAALTLTRTTRLYYWDATHADSSIILVGAQMPVHQLFIRQFILVLRSLYGLFQIIFGVVVVSIAGALPEMCRE